MAQQTINAGPPYSGAGDLLAVGWAKANANFNELYALQSKTLSAADPRFTASTIEATINNAINLPNIGAVAVGAQRVVVPANFLPYDPTKVTFSPLVQMVREGGDWSVYDVTAYGADPSQVLDSTVAFTAPMLATPGGVIAVPTGDYLVSATINQTFAATGKNTLIVHGIGQERSRIHTSVTTTPGWVIGGTANDQNHTLENIDILQTGNTLPGAQRAGNYGVQITGNNSPGLTLRNMRIRYFGDSGVRNEGGHGPIVMENIEIQSCSNYGYYLIDFAGVTEEDISWRSGNIQFCWGGLYMKSNKNCTFQGIDVELATNAQLPALYTDGSCEGNSFVGCTVSVGAVPTPAAVVYSASGRGNVWIGGLNVTTVAGVDNILFDTGNSSWNTVIGGSYNNVSPAGGWYCNINNGSRNTLITPRLVGFTSGRGLVNDATGGNIAIGVGTNALATDYGISASSGAVRQGVLTPATFASGNNNNYALSSDYATFRVSGDPANSVVTGMSGGAAGRRVRFVHVGGGTITISNQDANSQAANRFLDPGGASPVLTGNHIADFEYDASTSAWRIVSVR